MSLYGNSQQQSKPSNNLFDMNINHWEIGDLEKIFKLDKPYTKKDINDQCENVRVRAITHHNGDQVELENMLSFFSAGKDVLSKNMESDFMKSQPATIMENTSHDIIDRRKTQNGNVEDVSSEINARDQTMRKSIWDQNSVGVTLSIDTKFRESYDTTSSTDLYINLPNPIKKAICSEIIAFEFPQRYNAISTKHSNNNFHLTYENKSGTTTNILVPNGNYTADDLETSISDQIDDLDGDLSGVSFSMDDLGRVTISNSSSKKRYVNFQPDTTIPLNQTLGWMLGFRKKEYDIVEDKDIVSEGVYDSSLMKYLYIMVDDFNRNVVSSTIRSAYDTQKIGANIMSRITRRVYGTNPSETPYYTPSNLDHKGTKHRKYMGPVDINKLHIQILDEYGRVVDLDKMDFSMAIKFNCVYD